MKKLEDSMSNRLVFVPDSDIRNWVGPSSDRNFYFELGKRQALKCVDWLSISRNSSILDLGCGCGRIAIHFFDYLKEEGQYLGIDSNFELISFCKNQIEGKIPRFRFIHAPVYNGAYSDAERTTPEEYVFPIENEAIDTIICWSVFTHMYFWDMECYLKECHRVLKKDGNMILAFNLLNPEIERNISHGKSSLNIKFRVDDFSFSTESRKHEECFAHDESRFSEMITKIGLRIARKESGTWSGISDCDEYHDVISIYKINN